MIQLPYVDNGENVNNPEWATAMMAVYNKIEADEEVRLSLQ